jgi:predicted dienelactone hydrolase
MPPLALAALLSILLAGPARADDACLSGASTLGDQRALATLADATETACPCDQARRARAWRRCARHVLREAVGAGGLRADCERTAKRIVRGTSCGSRTVPCGAVAAGAAGGEATCRLARPKACRDSRRTDRTACTGETSCADVLTWTAGTCDDPRDEGDYTPGVRVVSWTKDSAALPGTPRTLETVIWYPAAEGSGPETPEYRAVLDAPVARNGAPYPVVLFSHGSCGYALQSLFLTPLLASRGFIVVAPPHPGNTLAEFPTCGTPAALAQAFLERPRDMIFVLDRILDASADPTSPFFGAADPDRVAMTGHSFGGLTTFLVSAADSRVKAAVAMAPATLANSRFAIPSLIALGNIDGVVDNEATRKAWTESASPKLLVEIEHAGHYAFSDLCFPSDDCSPPVTLTQDEAHAAALRWIVPFLERYLAGRPAAAPLLGPPTGPGFLYQSAQ